MRYSGTVFQNRIDDWLLATQDLFSLHQVKTSDGRIGSFRIEALSPASPRTMLVNYVTWE